jgi:IS30 family transposase
LTNSTSVMERRLPPALRAALWKRLKGGESLQSIARALGRNSGTVRGWFAATGGIEPPARVRSERHLKLSEREEISRGLAAGWSIRHIAKQLKRDPATVSREIKRNGGPVGYRAALADQHAYERARRPKRCRLALNRQLAEQVGRHLQDEWSPKQIEQRLKRDYPHDAQMQVSHETIYRTLYVQARGALKKELMAHLRKPRSMRRPKSAVKVPNQAIPNMVNISERPPEVEDRAVPGHWEGDLLCGANNSAIATLVERHSRFVMLVKINGKDTTSVVDALIAAVQGLPKSLMTTLTWDQGRELAHHSRFTIATDVEVFFCDPRSPWQRGSNENTNGLLRQYFPHGMDLSQLPQSELNRVSARLNGRPRQTLNWRTPQEALDEALR